MATLKSNDAAIAAMMRFTSSSVRIATFLHTRSFNILRRTGRGGKKKNL